MTGGEISSVKMSTETKEGEQQTEQTHDILPNRTVFQLLSLRIEHLPSDSAPLVHVPSKISQSGAARIIEDPCDQSWEPSRDRHEENERSREIPEGPKTSEQGKRLAQGNFGPRTGNVGGHTLGSCMIW